MNPELLAILDHFTERIYELDDQNIAESQRKYNLAADEAIKKIQAITSPESWVKRFVEELEKMDWTEHTGGEVLEIIKAARRAGGLE